MGFIIAATVLISIVLIDYIKPILGITIKPYIIHFKTMAALMILDPFNNEND